MNDPSYLVILIERNYLAQLVNGLSQQKAILKDILKKNKYDVKASAELPKVNADLKEVTQTLLAYNNIINNRLQDVYGFQFQSIKVTPYPKEQENKFPDDTFELLKEIAESDRFECELVHTEGVVCFFKKKHLRANIGIRDGRIIELKGRFKAIGFDFRLQDNDDFVSASKSVHFSKEADDNQNQ